MLESSPASDTFWLGIVILACWILAFAAVAVWTVVYTVRILQLRHEARTALAEEEYTRLVLDMMAGYELPDQTIRQLPGWRRAVLLHVLRNLAAQITGAERERLVALMARVGFREAAFRSLGSHRAAERQDACILLDFYDEPAAVAGLREALRDRDMAVRLTAGRALLKKGKVESLRELLIALDFSPEDPPLLLAEIFALMSPAMLPEAIELLAEPMPDEWRRMLAIALGRLHAREAFEPILELRHLPSERMRAAVWVALRELEDPRAAVMVAEGLADPSATVRQAACECAGKCPSPAVLPRLVELLHDHDWWVRFAAAGALYDSGAAGRKLLTAHVAGAGEQDVGLQVLREREMEVQYGA